MATTRDSIKIIDAKEDENFIILTLQIPKTSMETKGKSKVEKLSSLKNLLKQDKK